MPVRIAGFETLALRAGSSPQASRLGPSLPDPCPAKGWKIISVADSEHQPKTFSIATEYQLIKSGKSFLALKEALAQSNPLQLIQQGAYPDRSATHPTGKYIFGPQLWVLKNSEQHLSKDELKLEFLEAADQVRSRHEALRRKFELGAPITGVRREPIPEPVRVFVWRRDEGKCVNCGSNERLEFDHIIPLAKGGSNTERNIQLLCEACNRSKGASI